MSDLFNGTGISYDTQVKYATEAADAWEENMKRGMKSVDAFAEALNTAEKLGAKIPPTMRRIGKTSKTSFNDASKSIKTYSGSYKESVRTISTYADNFANGQQQASTKMIRAYQELSKKTEETFP